MIHLKQHKNRRTRLFIAGLSPFAIAKKHSDAGIPSPTGREKRMLRRMVWLEGLAQQRQVPPGRLAVQSYEETERRRDEVADRINQIMVRRRKLERFIEIVEDLPELYTEFDAGQWAALVDNMTVHAKERITFTLTSGMEIEA